MPRTLHSVLDRLFANEGGWVEAGPLWRLVRDRQAVWGMTDEEMAARLGTTEARWIGKDSARRILLDLSGPRRPCAHESEWTRRARARDERARCRSIGGIGRAFEAAPREPGVQRAGEAIPQAPAREAAPRSPPSPAAPRPRPP